MTSERSTNVKATPVLNGSVEVRWIPKEKGKNDENAPTNKFVVDNVDCLCKMLKMRDEDVVEPPHGEHWSDRQASFKNPEGIFSEVAQLIGKNISM